MVPLTQGFKSIFDKPNIHTTKAILSPEKIRGKWPQFSISSIIATTSLAALATRLVVSFPAFWDTVALSSSWFLIVWFVYLRQKRYLSIVIQSIVMIALVLHYSWPFLSGLRNPWWTIQFDLSESTFFGLAFLLISIVAEKSFRLLRQFLVEHSMTKKGKNDGV
jgi:hypothetical protein